VAACATEPSTIDYTGETHRYVIDSIALPMNNSEARAFGVDLNRDRAIDNQLGQVIATLEQLGDITTHGPDMIAGGSIASSVELVADDLEHDDTVAVSYIGADGEHADVVGGAMASGAFLGTVPGTAIVHLPVFVDADPIVVRLTHMRANLTPDGRGGFDGIIAGAIDADEAMGAAFAGVDQMFKSRPSDHLVFFRMIDANRDFVATEAEFEKSSIIASLLAPDVTLDGIKMLSIGFKVHLSPCADGRCSNTLPAAPCFDRLRDGDETDVDCGGACGACGENATCGAASDCQSLSCPTGVCAPASCGNGVRDGFETDVDCGGTCSGCATGLTCLGDRDCASERCGEPCTGQYCELTFDVCR
jgi:hypothetical protein